MVNNKKCFFTVVLQRCCVFLCYLVVWFIISCTYFFRYHFNKAVTNPACKIKWEITPGDLAPSWNSVRLVFLVMWLRGREIILRIASLRIFSGGCVWRFLAHFQNVYTTVLTCSLTLPCHIICFILKILVCLLLKTGIYTEPAPDRVYILNLLSINFVNEVHNFHVYVVF